MFNIFLAVSPEIFLINATFILLIHGVVFSTSKKFDYPPLVSNVGWLGLLSVARLGGQRALGCGGAIIAQFPNLMRHRVRTAGNHSMGGLRILLPPQGWLIVRSRLEDPWFWKAHESERYVECATDTNTAGTISMCFDSSEQERFDASESIVLIPLPTRSMLFMISAYDSIAMYLAIEPQSLCFYGDRSTSFPIALGLCLDLLCAKSKGLVPMEIPLGLIPRLMTKGESAWRKVKIGGSREKFPSGVFRRSEGIQCPTTDSSRNCVIGAEPGMAVSGHPPSPVREALFNTLRKDVHRGQKDSEGISYEYEMLFTYKSDSAIRQLHSSAWHSSSNTSEVDNLMSCVKIVRTLPTGSLGHSSTKELSTSLRKVSETEDQSKGTRRPEGGFEAEATGREASEVRPLYSPEFHRDKWFSSLLSL
ncbi:hypothetical protein QVD17_42302 [Tagetes erecta]|uniref:NADH dehydrogenase subunit 2 n=1 Tax=Tagetes erecta TaxID=13708 RepID=A0AAD8NFC7_TARER|nr:hypothetical protein QVD17_42288 [Tagetes erecta]KAK1405991.1 hypothetical protein QVD17_42302 [Tagetes erecta]